MQVVLVMFRAEGDRRSFSVTRDVTVIGRREDCDLRIPVSEVSRKHCRIVIEDEVIRAEDLGSSNGTFHNGQRISGSVTLAPGDSIEVGPVVFVLQVDGVPPDDELAPFEDRAAHQLNDSLAAHPPQPGADDSLTAAENLEEFEESPSPAQELEPIGLAEDGEPAESDLSGSAHELAAPELDLSSPEIELSNDHGGHAEHEGHTPLNEDDLLLDLNAVEETHDKH